MTTDQPGGHPAPPIESPTHRDAATHDRRRAVRIAALCAAGIVAAFLAHAVIGGIGEVFELPAELAALGAGRIPGAEEQQRLTAANFLLRYKHAALWLGISGALLGGLFGLTLGLIRRSGRSALLGAVCGLASGGLFGAAGGVVAVYLDQFLRGNLPQGELNVPDHLVMLMHATAWLVMGLGIGLAASIAGPARGWRTRAADILVVGIAALAGGLLYPFVAGAVLPLADTTQPIPEDLATRLVWFGVPAVLMGVAAGRRG